ncbi:hypothetical protein IKG02_02460 [Candidatus Saccharibacteria bacterium]|nr:hypothetical protein [Candidatus Saccharibacteria bacterium]
MQKESLPRNNDLSIINEKFVEELVSSKPDSREENHAIAVLTGLVKVPSGTWIDLCMTPGGPEGPDDTAYRRRIIKFATVLTANTFGRLRYEVFDAIVTRMSLFYVKNSWGPSRVFAEFTFNQLFFHLIYDLATTDQNTFSNLDARIVKLFRISLEHINDCLIRA